MLRVDTSGSVVPFALALVLALPAVPLGAEEGVDAGASDAPVATSPSASASDDAPFGTLSPKAPPETAQYAFLIGEWRCRTKYMRPDGTFSEGTATWTGRYILDGWAIQDVWESPQPDGTVFQGTNIRSWNPEIGAWENRWLPQGTLQWKRFESSMVDGTMVMTGGTGVDPLGSFVDRNTFHEITEDSWTWRKDRSWDDGETWIEGVGWIYAERVR